MKHKISYITSQFPNRILTYMGSLYKLLPCAHLLKLAHQQQLLLFTNKVQRCFHCLKAISQFLSSTIHKLNFQAKLLQLEEKQTKPTSTAFQNSHNYISHTPLLHTTHSWERSKFFTKDGHKKLHLKENSLNLLIPIHHIPLFGLLLLEIGSHRDD